TGCRFHTRCWLRERLGNPTICVAESPPLVADGKHQAACHFAAETTRQSAQFETPLHRAEEAASFLAAPAEERERRLSRPHLAPFSPLRRRPPAAGGRRPWRAHPDAAGRRRGC